MLLQALLDYERHKTKGGELNVPVTSNSEPMNIENQVIFICFNVIFMSNNIMANCINLFYVDFMNC